MTGPTPDADTLHVAACLEAIRWIGEHYITESATALCEAAPDHLVPVIEEAFGMNPKLSRYAWLHATRGAHQRGAHRSAEALARYATGDRDAPTTDEYPATWADYIACHRVYLAAPAAEQDAMWPVLAEYHAVVAGRYPGSEPAPLPPRP